MAEIAQLNGIIEDLREQNKLFKRQLKVGKDSYMELSNMYDELSIKHIAHVSVADLLGATVYKSDDRTIHKGFDSVIQEDSRNHSVNELTTERNGTNEGSKNDNEILKTQITNLQVVVEELKEELAKEKVKSSQNLELMDIVDMATTD